MSIKRYSNKQKKKFLEKLNSLSNKELLYEVLALCIELDENNCTKYKDTLAELTERLKEWMQDADV